VWEKIADAVFFEIKGETFEDALVWLGSDLQGQMGTGGG